MGGFVYDATADLWRAAGAPTTVDMLKFDHAVGIVFSNGVDVRIETALQVTTLHGARTVDPEAGGSDLACLLPLLHRTADDLCAHADGSLTVRTPELTLRVPASTEFEAWSATAPDGAMLVSTPGGELAVWKSA